jgi:hypothetical protein
VLHEITALLLRVLGARIAQSGYGLDGRGNIFLFSLASRPALGPIQPPIGWVPRVKRLGCEVDYSPPSSAEVKNCGAIPPLPHFFMA